MKTDKGVALSDLFEARLQKRLESIFNQALMDSVTRADELLENIELLDKKVKEREEKGEDPEKLKKWRQDEARKILQNKRTQAEILRILNKAGYKAAGEIRKTMPEIYRVNREVIIRAVDAHPGYNISFQQLDARQIQIVLDDEQGVFSKIAYRNLGHNRAVRQRLQNEFATAALLGENKDKLTERIHSVTGHALWQARRVAQTERTRVQSQSRADAISEAVELGVNIENEWSTNMDGRARESHEELNGKRVPAGEDFLPNLAFPGDPRAPAGEIINCRCVLVPRVLLPKKRNKG